MGKSYRKPYVYWTKGLRESHKGDKILASRNYRRYADLALRMCEDWDEYLFPARLEARHNNVYSWKGDGMGRLYRVSNCLRTHWGLDDAWMTPEEFEESIRKCSRK